jgi:hypothetical protein
LYFDLLLKNKTEDPIAIGTIRIEGQPSGMNGVMQVGKTVQPGETVTVPVSRHEVFSYRLVKPARPDKLKIKVSIKDPEGNPIT